jgi:hypothetical protein
LTVKRIDCLSVPKSRDLKDPGDDVVSVLPDKFYGVFDGATDTTGTFRGPCSPGRFAATAAAQAKLRQVLQTQGPVIEPQVWLADMNAAIRDGLHNLGVPQARVSTTAAMAIPIGSDMHFLMVGDSGLRINGHDITHMTKDVDRLFTQVRLATREVLRGQGLKGDALEMANRELVFKGLDPSRQATILPSKVLEILAQVSAACRGQLMPDAMDCLPDMVSRGISGGQYQFANQASHSLAYASVDGSQTRGKDLRYFSRPMADVQSIELFTDGYMSCPQSGVSVMDWEANFAQDEAQDPEKIGRYAGVKGSTQAYFSDDRTVLSLSF